MRGVFVFACACLLMCSTCTSKPNSTTQPGGNGNVGGTQGGGDNNSDSGSNNDNSGSGSGDTGSGGNNNGSGNNSGDNGGASFDCLLASFDLNGFWIDHGSIDRQVQIQQIGGTIIATFTDPPFFVCDPDHGIVATPGPNTQSTSDDFDGTLTGCDIAGTVKVCHYGCHATGQSCTDGIIDATLTLTADFDNNHLTGKYMTADGEGSLSLERLPCRRKIGQDYVPTPDLTWTRSNNNADGTQVIYRAPAAQGAASITVIADVTGTVSSTFPAANGQPVAAIVTLPNGNAIEYDLFGASSQISLKPGDAVTPATPIGTLGTESDGGSGQQYAFAVTGIPTAGTPGLINPDCVESSTPP